MAHGLQVWLIGEIQAWESGDRLDEVMEAMQHSIEMRATVSQSLFNGLLDEVSGIVLM